MSSVPEPEPESDETLEDDDATARHHAEALNATAGSMLGLLTWMPRTGWELYQAFEATIGPFWSVTRSQIYRELRVLEAAGLIVLAPSGARDRRTASITEAGRRAFGTFIARRPGPESIRFPLLMTAFFGESVDPQSLRATFAEHRITHQERLASYEATMAVIDAGSFPALALRFGIDYERAVLTWIDGAISSSAGSGDSR